MIKILRFVTILAVIKAVTAQIGPYSQRFEDKVLD